MNKAWVLSKGEQMRGERVLGLFASYETAFSELERLAHIAGNAEIKEDWSKAIFVDGIFYTILRERAVAD